jgi:hypothetical protein
MGLQHFLALNLALCCGTFRFIDTTTPFGLRRFTWGGRDFLGLAGTYHLSAHERV